MRNNSDLKTMFREAGILFGITLLAGLLLGLVYEIGRASCRERVSSPV